MASGECTLDKWVRWAVAADLNPSQTFYIWWSSQHPAVGGLVDGFLRSIGGPAGAISIFMNNGGRELFATLLTPEGIAWLRQPGYLEDFLGFLLKMSPPKPVGP